MQIEKRVQCAFEGHPVMIVGCRFQIIMDGFDFGLAELLKAFQTQKQMTNFHLGS